MDFWIVLLFAFLTLTLIIDWLQTRQILKHPDRWRELNPIIDKLFKKNPWIYFLIWVCIFGALAFVLRNSIISIIILSLALGSQVHCIWRNWMEGIKLS